MPSVSKSLQTTNAQVLRDETQESGNTKLRVYNLLKDLIDSSIFFDQVVQSGGTSLTDIMSQKAVTDLIALAGGGTAIKETYADITGMIADQGDQSTGMWYRALDASDDPLVDSGWAIYEYLGTTNGDLTDYYFILDQESLNITIQDATPTVKGIMKLYTSTGASTDGTMDRNSITNALAAVLTAGTFGSMVAGSATATPNDTDLVPVIEGSTTKNSTWTAIKAFLKTYFDTIHEALNNKTDTVAGNTASSTKYLSVKGYYDYLVGLTWMPDASETVKGIAELATQTETDTGTDDARIVTPLKLKNASTVVHTTGNETVAGVKTFSSFPVTPSSSPSTDYQVANKKYVDDQVITQTDFPLAVSCLNMLM